MGDNNFGPLHAFEYRLKYKRLICSKLILSNVNKNREEVLKKLDAFNKDKESKFPLIIAQRELKAADKTKERWRRKYQAIGWAEEEVRWGR